jgi:hypothetical protein
VPTKSGLNPNPKPSRKDFDSVLKQLCDTPPLPNKKGEGQLAQEARQDSRKTRRQSMSDDEKLTSPREAWRICWGSRKTLGRRGECSIVLFGNCVIHLIEDDGDPRHADQATTNLRSG